MIAHLAIEMMGRLPEWEKQERLNFAGELLQVMEIQGMIIPEVICEHDTEFTKSGTFEMPENKWEPEDKPVSKAPEGWRYEGSSI